MYPPYTLPPPEPYLWKFFIIVRNDFLFIRSPVIVFEVDVRIVAFAFAMGLVVLLSMLLFHQRKIERN